MNQALPRPYHTNTNGIEFNSGIQAASLFTLKAMFRDGNKATFHSWRQEIKGSDSLVNHDHAFKRLRELCERCTCKVNPKRCIRCQGVSLLIFCNLVNQQVYKQNHGRVKQLSDLSFVTNVKGHTFLTRVNGDDVFQKVVDHARYNWKYNQANREG